jgi:polyhydroxyalkanoate synthase subunit PhaC
MSRLHSENHLVERIGWLRAAAAALKDGSWWNAWTDWLATHSASDRMRPPSMGAAAKGYPPIEDAPGTYVLQR